MIFNRLAEDVQNEPYFNTLFLKLSRQFGNEILGNVSEEVISEKELRDLLRFSDILSNSSNSFSRNLSYKLLSLLSSLSYENEIYKMYSTAILSKLGNFPAIKLLNYDIELPFDRKIETSVKKYIQKVGGMDNAVFTDPQYQLFNRIKNTNYYSFAGPTSMGKSFIIKALIREMILDLPKENIVIIVPTKALINQFVYDLNNELGQELKGNRYKIFSNYDDSTILPNTNYIFVLTPERLLSLLAEDNRPELGIVFVDEAHKLTTEKDYRSITMYLAIEKLIKHFKSIKVYFASPNVGNPEIFLQLFNLKDNNVYKTNEAPVGQNLFLIDLLEKEGKYFTDNITINYKLVDKAYDSAITTLFKLGGDNSNIIYTNSVDNTVSTAMNFTQFLKNKGRTLTDEEQIEIDNTIETIKEIIHPEYFLIECLRYGVGFHFGKLPHIIRQKVEKLFKKGIIKFLFCTSTLLEGVNLPAKNVFIFKNKKGLSKMSKIDFWNLAGRAGRLNSELSGNIFCIREGIKDWATDDLFFNKDNIKLQTSIDVKLYNNIKRIKQIISKDNDLNISDTEYKMLSYIANIMIIDNIENRSDDYTSPIMKKLVKDEKYDVLRLLDLEKKEIEIPYEIIQKTYSITVSQQEKVYKLVKKNIEDNIKVSFPDKVNYESCLNVLKIFHEIYEWENYEKKLSNKKKLTYYAQLMNNWINGLSLNPLMVLKCHLPLILPIPPLRADHSKLMLISPPHHLCVK